MGARLGISLESTVVFVARGQFAGPVVDGAGSLKGSSNAPGKLKSDSHDICLVEGLAFLRIFRSGVLSTIGGVIIGSIDILLIAGLSGGRGSDDFGGLNLIVIAFPVLKVELKRVGTSISVGVLETPFSSK